MKEQQQNMESQYWALVENVFRIFYCHTFRFVLYHELLKFALNRIIVLYFTYGEKVMSVPMYQL
jgi:hypothetical protein